MLRQTFICFYLNEAERLYFNHCSRLLDDVDDVECETFNLFVMPISRNLFVVSFQQMFHNTLCYHLPIVCSMGFGRVSPQ